MKNERVNLCQTHVVHEGRRNSFATLAEAVASFRFRLLLCRALDLAGAETVASLKWAFDVESNEAAT